MKRRTLEDINSEIQVIREQMFRTASEYGYSHERTVQKSQDLDKLINEYLAFNSHQNYDADYIPAIVLCSYYRTFLQIQK